MNSLIPQSPRIRRSRIAVEGRDPCVAEALALLPPEWKSIEYNGTGRIYVPSARPEVIRRLPWFDGNVPKLILAADGEACASLRWMDGSMTIAVSTGPYPSFEAAIDEAILMAAVHGRDEKVDWAGDAAKFTGGELVATVTMTNWDRACYPRFICQLRLANGDVFASPALGTRRSAFGVALKRAAEAHGVPLDIPAAERSEVHFHAMPRSRVWAFEFTWLSRQPFRTERQDRRLSLLKAFMGMSEPLHEAAPFRQLSLLELAHIEILEQARWLANDAVELCVGLLCALYDGSTSLRELESSLGFSEACARFGHTTREALSLLRERGLIKALPDGVDVLTANGCLLIDCPVSRFRQCSELGEMLSTDPEAFLQEMIAGTQQFAQPEN